MLFSEKKEREHKFILALRMGLPIFFISVIAISTLLFGDSTTIVSFIILALILLSVMVYFIFYLIDQGSKEEIIDPITKTFIYKYLKELISKKYRDKNFTLIMISIDNLTFINEHYGSKNGDKVLYKTVKSINNFFNEKKIEHLPISRYKGGDFLILLPKDKSNYIHLLELFLTKNQSYIIDEMECRLSAVIVDNKISDNVDQLIDRLYDMKQCNSEISDDEQLLSQLEAGVIDAIEHKRFSIGLWSVKSDLNLYDTSIKLLDIDNNIIHQSKYRPILNRLNKTREFESAILEKIVQLCDSVDAKFIVNISSVTLRNPYFFEYAMMLLQRYPYAKDRIILIFEDRDYCHKIDKFKEQITLYRNSGYMIALDRLGVSQTTLLYLKDIDVDFARFDSSYAKNIKNIKYQNMISGLNSTLKALNIKSIISQIEDSESDAIAKELSLDAYQGRFYGDMIRLETLIA